MRREKRDSDINSLKSTHHAILSSLGYSFQAVFDGTHFAVIVPPGGVKEGQTIQVPFQPTSFTESSHLLPSSSTTASHGKWKDGLCDCCKYSCLHASFLNACCCPQLLMAQVLNRMSMDYRGDFAPEWEAKLSFRRILWIVLFYYALSSILAPGPVMTREGLVVPDTPTWQIVLYRLLAMAFTLYTLMVLMKLRAAVRGKYHIPVTRCAHQPEVEDCCCSFWCGCCTVAQLARQTANYDEQRAICCSDDGLVAATIAAVTVTR